MVLFVLSIGPGVLARPPVLRQQLFLQLLVIADQAVLAIAYPLFSSVFNQLSARQQSAFIFVLPIIQFCIKQVIARMSSHLEECMGLIVVFSVDVCNVVYAAVWMQTAISPLTSTLMLATDAFFVMIALRSIYYHADTSHTWRQNRPCNSKKNAKSAYLQDLMDLIREAFRYATTPNALAVPIRVRAPIELPVSLDSARFISDLVHAKRRNAGEVQTCSSLSTCSFSRKEGNQGPMPLENTQLVSQDFNHISDGATTGSNHRCIASSPGTLGIVPMGPDRFLAISSNTLSLVNFEEVVRASARSTAAAPSCHGLAITETRDALQTLFHSEYVVMAEYVECAIPILYGVYLTCLYHLPTAAYYPHTRSMTPENFKQTQLNFMMYAVVEFVSFAGLNLLLKRKFGFSPLYLLAFVLETQVGIVQGHFCLWVSWILPITLVHNGVDLTAPFK